MDRALRCNGLLDSASFSAPPRHTLPRFILGVRHLTLGPGARQLTAMNGQAHPSGGAAHCQECARGCLTRRSAGPRTAFKKTIRIALRGLRCNALLDPLAALPFSVSLLRA